MVIGLLRQLHSLMHFRFLAQYLHIVELKKIVTKKKMYEQGTHGEIVAVKNVKLSSSF